VILIGFSKSTLKGRGRIREKDGGDESIEDIL
jgi:hypothetical protein